MFVWKDENKQKTGRGWPILKNILMRHMYGTIPFIQRMQLFIAFY